MTYEKDFYRCRKCQKVIFDYCDKRWPREKGTSFHLATCPGCGGRRLSVARDAPGQQTFLK